MQWSKAVNVKRKVCRDSVLILPAYFVNYIVRVRLSKSKWCVQLDAPNEKIFVKSVMSTRKSVESQKVGDKAKITSFSVSKVLRTEPRLFLTHIINLSFNFQLEWCRPTGRLQVGVVPSFKSGSREEMDNYRPISVLPVHDFQNR